MSTCIKLNCTYVGYKADSEIFPQQQRPGFNLINSNFVPCVCGVVCALGRQCILGNYIPTHIINTCPLNVQISVLQNVAATFAAIAIEF